MHAYLLILPIEPLRVGQLYESIPLHCTLMPWFFVDAAPVEILGMTKKICEDYGALELISEKRAYFGKSRNVEVHTLSPNAALMTLHRKLLEALNDLGAGHLQKEFVGEGYKPHVTTKFARAFGPGERALVKSLYLFEAPNPKQLQMKKTIAEIPLS